MYAGTYVCVDVDVLHVCLCTFTLLRVGRQLKARGSSNSARSRLCCQWLSGSDLRRSEVWASKQLVSSAIMGMRYVNL